MLNDHPPAPSSAALTPVGAERPASEAPAKRFAWPSRSLLMLIGTLLLTVGLVLVPGDLVARLGAYGYLGVFVLTLLASASIVLPSPALGVAALAGKTLNPWLVGLVGGVAAGLGEVTGYMAGLGGSSLAARSRLYSSAGSSAGGR